MKLSKKYLSIIGILIFIFILWKINLSRSLSILKNTNIFLISLAVLLFAPLLLLKAWRWQYLLKMQKIPYGIKDAWLTYLSSCYIGIITPGRLGEFVKTLYLVEDKDVSYGNAFSSVLADRLFDFVFLLLVALSGTLLFPLSKIFFQAILIIACIFILSIFLFLNKNLSNRILKVISGIKLGKYKNMSLQMGDFFHGMQTFKRFEIVFPIIMTAFAYFLFFFQCDLIAQSLGISIPFLFLSFCIAVTSLVILLPVSIFGIGTRDAVLIALFSYIGLSSELAVSFSILLLFSAMLANGAMGIIAWHKKPIKIKRSCNSA